VGGLKVCINIYAILRWLCGKFIVNLCFYHVYSFINLLSIFNTYVVQKLKIKIVGQLWKEKRKKRRSTLVGAFLKLIKYFNKGCWLLLVVGTISKIKCTP
jgi:uncharacterized membrane protein